MTSIWTPEQIKNFRSHMADVRNRVFETVHTAKDGTEIPVEISSSVINYQGKQVVLSITRNISERKKVEQELSQAKNDWERTFNSVTDFIAIVDNQNQIIRANQAMAQQLGVTPEKAIGLFCYHRSA